LAHAPYTLLQLGLLYKSGDTSDRVGKKKKERKRKMTSSWPIGKKNSFSRESTVAYSQHFKFSTGAICSVPSSFLQFIDVSVTYSK
uniref:Uncharacterized protein n=1 Tax=Oryza brachyantha TaxID=4533 RepID=J3LLJ2_ORYBR